MGERRAIASALHDVGNVDVELGDYPAAPESCSRRAWRSGANWATDGERYSVEGLAAVVAALGGSLRAAGIWGAAERLREEIGAPLPPNERPRYDRRVAAARAALGDDAAFDRAWQEGRALTIEQAIEIASQETVERNSSSWHAVRGPLHMQTCNTSAFENSDGLLWVDSGLRTLLNHLL